MAKPPKLNNCLGFAMKVLEISEANTVNAGRQAAGPLSPDQAADIEQDRRVRH